MGTWTADDGDVFRRLIGTRNGRLAVFMATDHVDDMKCKGVTTIYTWAKMPGDVVNKYGAMVMELGSAGAC